MSSLTIREHVEAPIELVFKLATDLINAPDIYPAILDLEILTPGEVGAGTCFRETRSVFGKEAVEELLISDFDPPNSYTTTCDSCGVRYDTHHFFVSDISGTHVRIEAEIVPISFAAKLLSPLTSIMRNSLRKHFVEDLQSLKRVAEERASKMLASEES